MYDYVFFDLDGTLTDSGPGITGAAQYALRQMGIDVPDRKSLSFCVGPPLLDVFMEKFGMTESEAEETLKKYREYYRERGLFENEVYPGMETLLKRLRDSGRKLIVATSKPETFAVTILEHFGLARYFDLIAGATFDGSRYRKDEVIRYAIESAGIGDIRKAVMVGDRKYDVEGAKSFGMASVGVAYGYGTREELEEAEADHIVDTVPEIEQYV